MGKILSRTRTTRPGPNSRPNSGWQQQSSSPTPSKPLGRNGKIIVIIIIVAVIAGVFYWVTAGSKKAAENARQEGPRAVVEQFFEYLGQGNESGGALLVQDTNGTALNEMASLFDDLALTGDDYITWDNLAYDVNQENDGQATVTVSGSADLVGVDKDNWTDYNGDEVEEITEELEQTYTFTDLKFGLYKTGDEWFLSSFPTEMF